MDAKLSDSDQTHRQSLRSRPRRSYSLVPLSMGVKLLARSWRLLAIILLGMLVASTLLCSVPFFSTLIASIQLQQNLQSDRISTRNIDVHVHTAYARVSDRSMLDPRVRSQAQQHLSTFVAPTPLYRLESDNMLPVQLGQHLFGAPPPGPLTRFEAFDYYVVGPHMHLSAGTFPQDDARGEVQVLITGEMANVYGLGVGSAITAAVPITTSHGKIVFGTKVHAQVVGIWEPKDANDPIWNNESFAAVKQLSAAGGLVVYQVLTTYDGYFALLQSAPTMGMTQHWIYATQSNRITTENTSAVAASVEEFRAELTTTASVDTKLDTLLRETESQHSARSQQLYIIVIQMLALSLLFVATMSILLVERQVSGLSTLRSRGASRLQLIALFVGQGMLLALLVGLVAPILAGILALALVHLFMPAPVDVLTTTVGAAYLPGQLRPSAAVLPAVAGAALGVGTLTVTAWQSTRLDVLAARRARGRSDHLPLWRRANLDVALVVLSLLGYLELVLFGSDAVRQQSGGSYSALGLFTPALLLLAGALVLLRIFPLLVRQGLRFAAGARGLTLMLALAQLARTPTRYTRLALLLAMAVAVGVFSLNFDATLQQSIYARSAYAVGADIRLTESQSDSTSVNANIVRELHTEPEVQAVSPAYRNLGTISSEANAARVDVLGIDPATFGQVASVSWHSDFATVPLNQELVQMRAHQLPAVSSAQGGSVASGAIWTLVSETFAGYLHLNVGDSFQLQVDGDSAPTRFVIGDVVTEFPTLYPARAVAGFIVFNIADFMGANNTDVTAADGLGANEFWLRVDTPEREAAALPQRLRERLQLDTTSVLDLYSTVLAAESTPESAGNRGLLFLGGLTAIMLASLGILAQTLMAARQRMTQFAVLRTLGLLPGRVTRILLVEQALVYLFGVVGGTFLGGLLLPAIVPFLGFGETTGDLTMVGVPPDQVVLDLPGLAAFYLALVVVFLLALGLVVRYVGGLKLSGALRFNED